MTRTVINRIVWYFSMTLLVIFAYGAIAMGIFIALLLIKRLTSTLP